MRSVRCVALAVSLVALLPLGCRNRSATAAATAPKPPDPEAGLKQLGEMYKYIAYEKAKVPGSVADLPGFIETIPDAYPLVKSGDIVVAWGKGFSANSTAVLAYPKAAKTAGGPVLLRNGTVKTMTAAEFQAAATAGT